ncbi:hypothetical protein [Planomicrobium sp. CPCC 101110]|uniref:hypothetical protein n=1 Tax=Planomicrobium sp. CPCC 101110 TaxID=2599619 RepID=UPI0011B8082D|nr:hypothetical protein [Planomicrobium sp. CPCC 101110]TWT25255.1 hypothetical protein FQV30_12885 [Planomicrobium sp. CPCC 101110]
MEENKMIHTYQGPKYDKFWRTAFVVILLAGALIGLALVAAPIYFYMKFRIAWLLIFFIFIPFGVWLVLSMLRHIKKLEWRHNHLSSYTLSGEKIEALEWGEAHSKSPIQRVVPLSAVSSVIASSYIIRQTISQGGFSRKITETGPILYILYTENGQQKVLNIPFQNHGDQGMNAWLTHLQKHGLPIQYTARQLYRIDTQHFTDEQRLEYFQSSGETVDFPFTGNWLTDEPQIWAKWKEKDTEKRAQEEALDPKLKKARQKHTFFTWMFTIWLVYMLMFLAGFVQTKIGGFLPFPAGNIIPGLLFFTMGGFLFFYCLRSYLRWYYMLSFSLLAVIIGISFGIISDGLPGTEAALAMGICLSSFAYPSLVWIPYFTVKTLRTRKKTSTATETSSTIQ